MKTINDYLKNKSLEANNINAYALSIDVAFNDFLYLRTLKFNEKIMAIKNSSLSLNSKVKKIDKLFLKEMNALTKVSKIEKITIKSKKLLKGI